MSCMQSEQEIELILLKKEGRRKDCSNGSTDKIGPRCVALCDTGKEGTMYNKLITFTLDHPA